MPSAFESWLWWVTTRLLEGSIYGGAVIALVWVVCRQVKSIPPSARAMLWWLASLKLIVALVPVPSFGVAVLPATPPLSSSIVDADVTSVDRLPGIVDTSTDVTTPQPPTAQQTRSTALRVVGAVWFAGVTILAVQLFVSYLRLRRTVRRSSPAAPSEVEMVARVAGLLALRTVPTVRLSREVRTPVVVGIVRPTVLLPAAEIAALNPGEREMAIGHELAHIRRRDLTFGWIPAIAERVFFFHPLARVAAREYVAEREAACDAMVVHLLDVAPRDYGEMLVRLGVGRFGPVLTATGSPPSMSSLRRRLDMLHDLTATRSRLAGMTLFAVLATAAVVPFQLTARALQAPTAPAQAAPTPAPARRVTAEPVAAPTQAPAPREPGTAAPRRVTPADEKQLSDAVAEQRDQMREMERALAAMRKQFEQLVVRTETMHQENGSNAARRVVREQMQAVAEQQRREGVNTQQFLEDRLRALVAEQEITELKLRQIAREIETLRKQLETRQRLGADVEPVR